MKNMLIVLMLVVATMMTPVSGSATPYTDRASWEAAVGSFAALADLPGTTDGQSISAFTDIALPAGGSFYFNEPLLHYNVPSGWNNWSSPAATEVLASFNSNGSAYYANGNFTSGPVSAFGFEMEANLYDTFTIALYLVDGTIFSQTVTTPGGAKFFGWAGEPVTGFTALCYYNGSNDPLGFAMGNFVEGTPGTPVPEPSTMLLLGSGLIGLWGFRKKFKR